jgi:2-polyprenyl-6-methoxyphenol hydroxylase-like FAD-dependent oxidoreductase
MVFHSRVGNFLETVDGEQSFFDVVICGAGPVGLFLSCELALAKCSVLVLERTDQLHSHLKQLPFGLRGLNALSVEALYRRGLLDQLEVPKRLKDPHADPLKGPSRQVGHFAGIPLLAGKIDSSRWISRLPGSTETSLISELEELETTLTHSAQSLGVEIRRGHAVTGLDQSEDEVAVACGELSFRGQWLVGCDGAHSVVRKASGFHFLGTEPEFTGYSAQVDLFEAEKLKPGRNITPTGMYMQSQPGYLAIQDFDGGAFHASGNPITLDHLQAVLRRVSNTDVTVRALHLATTWTDRAKQATVYRRGRVLLAGDAAHIHAPLGGQGLNLGLGDAMNLGWKLANVIRTSRNQQKAPANLLESYETERHPIGAKVLDWSRAQAAIMKPDSGARALHAIFSELMQTQDGATYIAERLWGLTTHYDLVGDHPLIGHSVPNFEFEDGSTIGEIMRDGQGILLDFKGSWALQALSNQYRELRYIAGPAKQQLGMEAVLVRPDGFVAWACNSEPGAKAIEQAADLWFARKEMK